MGSLVGRNKERQRRGSDTRFDPLSMWFPTADAKSDHQPHSTGYERLSPEPRPSRSLFRPTSCSGLHLLDLLNSIGPLFSVLDNYDE